MATGRLVAFEGVDRAGKTSVISSLPAALSECRTRISVCGELRSPLGPTIRAMLAESASAFLKTYFFAADRAWSYERECMPALMRGELVLWDRYVDSALVYRAVEGSRKPGTVDMQLVRDMNRPFRAPDLTIILSVSAAESSQRAKASATVEPYDSAFLTDVMREYERLSALHGYCIVDACHPLAVVSNRVATVVRNAFPELFP